MTEPTILTNMSSRIGQMRPAARVGLAAAVATVVAVAAIFLVRSGIPAVKNLVQPYVNNAKVPFLENTRPLCADFKDAAGLYAGNKVLLLGVEIGSVTAVTNKPDHVQVDFEVPADLDLPADVGAASYTQSVITNRSIELSKPYTDGPKFKGGNCIPLENTRTPVTVTESFAAINKLADTIMEAPPGADLTKTPGVQALNETLKAAARSLQGTGPEFRQMLDNITVMVGDPYKADAEWRQLLETSSIVTSNWLQHWGEFSTLMTTLPQTARLIEGLSANFGEALDHLVSLAPVLTGMIQRASSRVYKNITDKLFPWLRDILNAYTPAILSFFSTLPPLANWMSEDFYLPNMKTHNVTYIPPRVAISPEQASAICQNLRARNTPGVQAACAPGTASDPVTLGLTNLIMGAALS